MPKLQFNISQINVVVDDELSPGTNTTINGKDFTIPFGSIIYHTNKGITTVFDSSGVQLLTTEDIKAKRIWTPSGLKPATRIHEVPSGSFINTQNNIIYIIYQKQVIWVEIDEEYSNGLPAITKDESSPPDWPPNYVEGIEYAPDQDLKKFSSNWTVPLEPSDSEPLNVICMWNGLHRTTSYDAVIQPVVTWNEDGDHFFKGRVWVVSGSNLFKSSPISTRPGHKISGILTWDEELEY